MGRNLLRESLAKLAYIKQEGDHYVNESAVLTQQLSEELRLLAVSLDSGVCEDRSLAQEIDCIQQSYVQERQSSQKELDATRRAESEELAEAESKRLRLKTEIEDTLQRQNSQI